MVFFATFIIHSYSFIENRNDTTHLHKYMQYKKKIKTVKTVNNSP